MTEPALPIGQEVLERLRTDLATRGGTGWMVCREADLVALLADHDRLTKAYKWFSESSQVRKDGASG